MMTMTTMEVDTTTMTGVTVRRRMKMMTKKRTKMMMTMMVEI